MLDENTNTSGHTITRSTRAEYSTYMLNVQQWFVLYRRGHDVEVFSGDAHHGRRGSWWSHGSYGKVNRPVFYPVEKY